MYVKKILLQNFRLFPQLLLDFKKQVTLLIASNAGGKSTVVEALELLSVGRSFRVGKAEEMIAFGKQLARARCKVVSDGDAPEKLAGLDELELGVTVTRGVVNGKRTRRQIFSVNKNNRSKIKFIGQLLVVVFRPEDMRLIEGSPSRRRDFLDNSLIQADREYAESFRQYEKTLRRRNKLLSAIKDGEQSANSLTFWNMSLIKHGERLQHSRLKFVQFINSSVEAPLDFRIKYSPSIISEQRLREKRSAELGAGFTLIGPHRDDFKIFLKLDNFSEYLEEDKIEEDKKISTDKSNKTKHRSLDAYGSRGQKRMGVVWLKKAELAYLKHAVKRRPVLLLDDILSELDSDNQARVLELIQQEQAIITTADDELAKEVEGLLDEPQVVQLDLVN